MVGGTRGKWNVASQCDQSAARRLWRAGINGLEEDAMGDQDDDDDGDEEDFGLIVWEWLLGEEEEG